jgi:hypothetical protein
MNPIYDRPNIKNTHICYLGVYLGEVCSPTNVNVGYNTMLVWLLKIGTNNRPQQL